MGTKNGIGRFDGYEQKKYLNCNIDQLVEDRNNNIWALGSDLSGATEGATEKIVGGIPGLGGGWMDKVIQPQIHMHCTRHSAAAILLIFAGKFRQRQRLNDPLP